MRKQRFSEDQIVRVLRQPSEGISVQETCRRNGITRQTYYRWRIRYGDLLPNEIRRIRQLEDENRRLRRLVGYMRVGGQPFDRATPMQDRAASGHT